MLIELNESISKVFSLSDDVMEHFWDTLALALKYPHHIYIAKPKSIISILKQCKYSNAMIILKKMFKESTYNKGLFNYVGLFVSINFIDYEEEEEIEHENGLIEKKLSYKRFLDDYLIRECSMTPENTSDGKYYDFLAHLYAKHNDLNIDTEFNITNGNGSGINKEYKIACQNRKIHLFISESDQLYPNDKLGSTCTRLQSEIKGPLIISRTYFEFAEIENIIPSELYEATILSETKSDIINFIKMMDNSDFNDRRFYFDFKKGLPYKIFHNNDCLEYWSPIINACNLSTAGICTECCNLEKDNACSLHENPNKWNNQPCRKKIITGFGSKVAETCFNCLDKFPQLEDLPSLLKDKILEIGKLIFSWGCKQNPSIMNYQLI